MRPSPVRIPTRRDVAKTVLFAPFLLRAAPNSSRALVKIDPARIIGAIDPKIYGNFTEHLGRCIEGGIFQENSPVSDANGYRRDVFQAVKDLNVTLLRWPGGNFASNYFWTDGIGPRDQRPARLELAWGTVEDNRFGTNEFLNYCEMLGTQPYLCLNLGTGSWELAERWIEYTNSSQPTAMAKLRQKNGRQQPWKVQYWGLGNEMDGPWQMGHRTASDYANYALEASKILKLVDPSVKTVACGAANLHGDWVGWNRTVLETLKDHADYISLHLYVGNKENNFEEFMASSLELQALTKTAEGLIRAALLNARPGKKFYIAWDEWNVWYRERGEGKEKGRHILEEHYNLEDALVVATFLNTFINNAHIVKIANLAQLVNVIAPIFTNDNGLFLQTIYFPLQLFANNSKGNALELAVECPTYTSQRWGDVPYLDVSAAHDNGSLVLNVINRHRTEAIEAEFEPQDAQFSGSFTTAEVNGPDIKSENTFGTRLVGIKNGTASVVNNRLIYRFPPHSYTMLKGRMA